MVAAVYSRETHPAWKWWNDNEAGAGCGMTSRLSRKNNYSPHLGIVILLSDKHDKAHNVCFFLKLYLVKK